MLFDVGFSAAPYIYGYFFIDGVGFFNYFQDSSRFCFELSSIWFPIDLDLVFWLGLRLTVVVVYGDGFL